MFSAMYVVLLGAREAGCLREVAALYSDRYRQVPLHTVHKDTVTYRDVQTDRQTN